MTPTFEIDPKSLIVAYIFIKDIIKCDEPIYIDMIDSIIK